MLARLGYYQLAATCFTPNVIYYTMASTCTLLSTLRYYSIRSTPIRRAVLQVLQQACCALSGSEIEVDLPAGTDRITLYRTLRTFEDKRLIHRIMDYSEIVRYALCPVPMATVGLDHVHLKCVACQRIFCLPQVAVPPVPLLEQYQVVRIDYLLSGICAKCRPNHSAE